MAGDLLAWVFFVCGGALRLWSTLYVGGRKGRVVVDEGPYSLCRNPLYLGTFLLAASFAVFLKSPTLMAAMMLVAVLYTALTIPAEERHLAGIFGDAYRTYRDETPRFMPRFTAYRSGRIIEVDTVALLREIKKALGWVLLPLLAETVAHLRQAPWWPSMFGIL